MKNVFSSLIQKIMSKSHPNFEYDQLKLTARIKQGARDEEKRETLDFIKQKYFYYKAITK